MKNLISTNVYVAVVVALGGFIFGFDASVISGVVGFVTDEFSLNEWQQGFVVSSPTLGAVVGSFFAGPCADFFGRKKVIITIALLYVISAMFSAFAFNFEMLVIARMIGGLAFASLILAPMYIAEISPAKMRGKMISINQFNIVIGFSVAYFANYYLLQLAGSTEALIASLGIKDNVWRWMLGLEIVPAIIYLALLFTIPESPRWLMINNKIEAAKPILKKLFPALSVEQAIRDIQHDQPVDHVPLKTRVKLLFSNKMRFILLIGLMVGIFQQITGVNAVYFYAPSIFEQSGIGQNAAFSQAIWVGIINVVFTVVAMLLIDKLGRKPLLLIGLAGIFISMSLASYGFYNAKYQLTEPMVASIEHSELREKISPLIGQEFNDDVSFKNATIALLGETDARKYQSLLIQSAVTMNPVIVLIGILGFVASFAISLGPVMWVLLAEIFPNNLRGIGIAFTGLVNSAVSFSVQLFFPWELATLGTAITFLLYGIFALIGFVFIYRFLPETKGCSLEEIELLMEKSAQK